MKKRIVSALLALALLFGLCSAAYAASSSPGSGNVNGSAAYIKSEKFDSSSARAARGSSVRCVKE